MYRHDDDGALEAKIFDSEAIPEGWSDSPANIGTEPVEPSEKDTLLDLAAEKGIEVNARLGVANLRAALEEAGAFKVEDDDETDDKDGDTGATD
jgi:hypothetical protein